MKRILLAIAVVALLLAMVTTIGIASADSSQAWYLDKDNHPHTGLIMEKEGTGSQSGTVDILAGDYLLWLADEAAQADVTFPVTTEDNPWVIFLKTTNWASKCTAQVGRVGSDKVFYPFVQTQGLSKYITGGILKVPIQTVSETIHTGDYLAIKINNSDTSDKVITTDGSSYLSSPDSDPGYPLAEVAAGILLGGGLIGLGSYVAIRRKRTGAARS